MTNIEKLADEIGQCVFRTDCYLELIEKRLEGFSAGGMASVGCIRADLEKLKEIKTNLIKCE